MNCKPGDLAVVVACKNNPKLVGRLVECVRVVRQGEVVSGFHWKAVVGGPSWLVQAAGGGLLPWGNHMVAQRVVADANLRPIRDPGDDAQDETLSWLPVPSREGQPA